MGLAKVTIVKMFGKNKPLCTCSGVAALIFTLKFILKCCYVFRSVTIIKELVLGPS